MYLLLFTTTVYFTILIVYIHFFRISERIPVHVRLMNERSLRKAQAPYQTYKNPHKRGFYHLIFFYLPA